MALPCNGYYINDKNDSILCTFFVPIDRDVAKPIFIDIQKKIKCKEALTGKTKVLKPKGVLRYGFMYDTTNYVFQRVNFGKKKDSQTFVHKIASGYLSSYEYYAQDLVEMKYINYNAVNMADRYKSQNVAIGVFVNYLMQKNDAPFTLIDGLNFKNSLSYYFSDYPELADKIRKGVYTKKTMSLAIAEYNQVKTIK